MSLFANITRVRAAQVRTTAAREALTVSAAALLARGYRYPLSSMATAVGAGFVLGRLKLSPLRVPGLGGLLNGGLAEALAYGTKLLADLDLSGAASSATSSPPNADSANVDPV